VIDCTEPRLGPGRLSLRDATVAQHCVNGEKVNGERGLPVLRAPSRLPFYRSPFFPRPLEGRVPRAAVVHADPRYGQLIRGLTEDVGGLLAGAFGPRRVRREDQRCRP